MQNHPQDENLIKKALRTWRALREIKKEIYPLRLNSVPCTAALPTGNAES
jgi:hypothetical protein